MSRLPRLLPAFAVVAAAMVLPPATAPSSAATTVRHPEQRAPVDAPRFMSLGERAAGVALTAVGIPYRWGGESPASGFDCSGLVRWSYGRVGVELPHSSYALYDEGMHVQRSRLEPGDVLFFSGLGHVGLYLGSGRMVHAPYSGRRVEVVRLATTNYGRRLVGARRVVPA